MLRFLRRWRSREQGDPDPNVLDKDDSIGQGCSDDPDPEEDE